jgi:NTP pyrophosphatase (non-canonical NTP hydrolase)
MESRKELLQRQLKDIDALIQSITKSIGDTDLLEHCSRKRAAIVFELAKMNIDIKKEKPSMHYEQELLTIMMEECGEVIQACSKIIRFGATDEKLKELEKELGDLFQMMELAHQYDLVSWTGIDEASSAKAEKLKKYSSLMG